VLILSQSTTVGDKTITARLYRRVEDYAYYLMVNGVVRIALSVTADSDGTATAKFDLLYEGHIQRFREEVAIR
jgi:hypothetical protein